MGAVLGGGQGGSVAPQARADGQGAAATRTGACQNIVSDCTACPACSVLTLTLQARISCSAERTMLASDSVWSLVSAPC